MSSRLQNMNMIIENKLEKNKCARHVHKFYKHTHFILNTLTPKFSAPGRFVLLLHFLTGSSA